MMLKRKWSTAKTCTEHPPPKSEHFPFLKLPAEIRNSIYQHCFSVDRHHLCFSLHDARPDFDPPQPCVTTSLLCLNKQVYTEAMPILYSGSMSVTIGQFTSNLFRHDQATRGSHSLRHGRLVSNSNFTGRIYPHVLARFRKIILSINMLTRRRACRPPGSAPLRLMDIMVESPQLERQIQGVLRALKLTLRSSFTGPRVREIKIINTNSLKSGSHLPEIVAGFKRGQKRLLMPFAQLFGLQSVQIVGVSDQDYANQLKRIMEGDSLGSPEARQALMRMIKAGNKD